MFAHTYSDTCVHRQICLTYSCIHNTNIQTHVHIHTITRSTQATHMFVCVCVCVSICVCLFVALFLFLLLSSSLSPFACTCIYIQNWASGKAPRNIYACWHMLTRTPPHPYVSNTGLHTFLNDVCYRFAHFFHINISTFPKIGHRTGLSISV